MYHSGMIGGRPDDLGGQRKTLTPYRTSWVTTWYKGARYAIKKHPLNDVYKWQCISLNSQTVTKCRPSASMPLKDYLQALTWTSNQYTVITVVS
ncbi:hypothetical protein TNCV_4083071 [Trichonephila clavipes]|nr:hypothetical protein TNCV_4083071 [Trichonephila clavipes]